MTWKAYFLIGMAITLATIMQPNVTAEEVKKLSDKHGLDRSGMWLAALMTCFAITLLWPGALVLAVAHYFFPPSRKS